MAPVYEANIWLFKVTPYYNNSHRQYNGTENARKHMTSETMCWCSRYIPVITSHTDDITELRMQNDLCLQRQCEVVLGISLL